MRTIIDILPEQRHYLHHYCARQDVSRAEAIRRAITLMMQQAPLSSETKDIFGLWEKRDIPDGIAFQQALRDEWE